MRFTSRSLRCASLAAVFVALGAEPLQGQATAGTTRDSLLARLVGDWRMVGNVRGQPVVYALTGRPTLNGRFVELHMIDTVQPPRYEARVFIGADTVPGRVLVHWLDSFGAASSVPHGVGVARGDTLEFTFEYATGPFKDTFVYDRTADTWTMHLDAGDGRGGWRPFASYTARRETVTRDPYSDAGVDVATDSSATPEARLAGCLQTRS